MALLEKLSEEEVEFMQCFHDSVCLAETLFSDYNNLSFMKPNEFAHIRLGQLSMLSYEYIIDENPDLTMKENFKLLEGAGNIYNFGARRYGKSLITLILDMLMSVVHLDGWETVFSSYDAVHIRSVLERVIPVIQNHPFFKLFDAHIKRSPTYLLRFNNGFVINSVNQNVMSKNSGSQWFGFHVKKVWIEEASFETEDVYEKRVDAISELGCIERLSGMTNFTKYSPAGKIFGDLSKKPWLVNVPQFINPFWDKKEKAKAIKKYGGESAIGYRVFTKGEIVEEGISVFDMERVRKTYLEDKFIKHIEISKDNYHNFKQRLIIEKPANASSISVAADVGESAPTEIIVLAKINKKHRYIYNITLHNLTDKQQYEIFKFIINVLSVNFCGLDCTDGTGRAIFRSLANDFPKENLIWVAFNEKLPVDFEKDDKDKIIIKNGKPVYKEEYVSEWSIQRLKTLLYDKAVELLTDYKFDTQFNSVVSMQSANRVIYKCIADEDHLFQAFQVFSIMAWDTEFRLVRPMQEKAFFKSGV